MKVEKLYISDIADNLLRQDHLAFKAYHEVEQSICLNRTAKHNEFILNNSQKNCNGVVPIKEGTYRILEDNFCWYREKPLSYFHDNAKKGGPIDVYKEFCGKGRSLKAGLEFETGNISSSHRSVNKLCVGCKMGEINLAMLMLPVKEMSFYLTDRVSNYEELEPYFILLDTYPFVVFGFNADVYDDNVPLLPKGKDGMSHRVIRRWQS